MTDNQILLYETEDGETRVEVLHHDETLWLSQRDMAELFQVTSQNIGIHIKNIYDSGELYPDPTQKGLFTSSKRRRAPGFERDSPTTTSI